MDGVRLNAVERVGEPYRDGGDLTGYVVSFPIPSSTILVEIQ